MMRSIQLAVACVVVLVATAGQVQAGSITTLFASNNGGNQGGAFYFDINVTNPAGITIKKLFTNTNGTFVLGNMDVYTRSGTVSGFQTTVAGWTLVSSGLGNSAGPNNPSEFDVTDFSLGFGITGISIVSSDSVWGHRYTDGNGSNQFYSNSDLSLTMGSATNFPFTGEVFQPRVWNGIIEYSVSTAAVPEPTSLAVFGLSACCLGFGSARRRRQDKKRVAAA
jgi:hypothetical protein